MKLRHKLLLLAAMPLPAILLVALLSVVPRWEQIRDSRVAGNVAEALDAASRMTGALIDERTAVMQRRANDAVSLESLLTLDNANLDSLLDAPEGNALGDAVIASDRAISAYAEAIADTRSLGELRLTMNELLDLARRAQTQRATRDAETGLIAAVLHFKPVIDATGDLYDRASTWLTDEQASDMMRARAAMHRLRDAVASTHGLLGHANATSQATPAVARYLTSLSFQENLQQRLLNEVTQQTATKRAVSAELDRANAQGRARAIDQLLAQSVIQIELGAVLRPLGFNGLIHHFKNYVLRADDSSRARSASAADETRAELARLRTVVGSDPQMLADIAVLGSLVDAYAANLETVSELRAAGQPSAAIDDAVRIDDEPAIQALLRLRSWRSPIASRDWSRLTRQYESALLAASLDLEARIHERLASQRAAALESGLLLIAVLATIVLLTLIFTTSAYRRLTGNLNEFLSGLQQIVQTGDIGRAIRVTGRDELAEIQGLVSRYNRRLGRLADVAEAMAIGNLELMPEPISDKDRLAIAMRSLSESARGVVREAESVAEGNYDASIRPRSDQDAMAHALVRMNASLRDYREQADAAAWTASGQLAALQSLRNPDSLRALAQSVLSALGQHLECPVALAYSADRDGLSLLARHGVPDETPIQERLSADHGQLSRALQSATTLLLDDLPDDYLHVSSGLGSRPVQVITLTALRASGRPLGILEFGWTRTPPPEATALLDTVAESVAIAFDAAASRTRTDELLQETQALADRLEQQQEELRTSNEELEEQTQALRQSEEELKMQREELQTTNEELEEKSEALEAERRKLETLAEDLQQATRYKSEFLANMSHELRTPLNSMLILSKQLADNEDGNLDPDQAEAARVVNESGRDLLNLINEILDLSKVEAGQIEVHVEAVSPASVAETLVRQFQPQADARGITLRTELEAGLADALRTDRQRLQQILRNLLSNAIKFTTEGEVSLRIRSWRSGDSVPVAADGESPPTDALLCFGVHDSGIGIAQEKLEEIFKPFIQADGSTSRRYGGTGLGLSICREFATLLGGVIDVSSEAGVGSTFTLILPTEAAAPSTAGNATSIQPEPAPSPRPAEPAPELAPAQVVDDREIATEPGSSILIIEDDPRFAAIVRDQVRSRGHLALVALDGGTGLAMAARYRPRGIVLDLQLPDMDGTRVLDALKQSLATRHIPVHIISGRESSHDLLNRGAIGFLAKPAGAEDIAEAVSRIDDKVDSRRRVLVVEDDASSQAAIRSLLSNPHTDIDVCDRGTEALERLGKDGDTYDCVVLDLSLPDIDGFELLRKLRERCGSRHAPVVVYTGRSLSREEHRELSEMAQGIVIKGAESPERLLDEVTLFLHSINESLPESQRKVLERLHDGRELFKGRKLLLVDDDLRNSFALSGLLKKQGFEVSIADNGEMALKKLDEAPDTDVVLMDIMMPIMDGYEAIEAIRAQDRFAELPVIALTAKAMPEDRRKCIEAGANDYLGKPVDVDRLLSVIRVWLGRAR